MRRLRLLPRWTQSSKLSKLQSCRSASKHSQRQGRLPKTAYIINTFETALKHPEHQSRTDPRAAQAAAEAREAPEAEGAAEVHEVQDADGAAHAREAADAEAGPEVHQVQHAHRTAEAAGTEDIMGRRVTLQGLSKAELNGAVGKVVRFDMASGRYVVELESGVSFKVLENLTTIDHLDLSLELLLITY